MTDQQTQGRALSEEELQDLVSSSDAGARNPEGPVSYTHLTLPTNYTV